MKNKFLLHEHVVSHVNEPFSVRGSLNAFSKSINWLIGCIGVYCHFNSKGHIIAVADAHVFPGFPTPVLTLLFFPKPPTTFLTCFCRGERRKYAGKKVRPNRGSNSKPPGHESDTLTTEPPGQGKTSSAQVQIC